MSDTKPNSQQPDTNVNVTKQSIEENYLDCLLQPIEGDSSPEQPLSNEPPLVVAPTEPEPVTELEPEPEPVFEHQETEEQIKPVVFDFTYDRERPFACQLFSLAGLKLAIPLSSCSSVIDKPEITPPASTSQSWLLDHIQHENKQLVLVDLGGLIFNRPYHDSS